MIEGGPTLTASFLAGGLADRLALFIAPKVFGDQMARSWVEGQVLTDPAQALSFNWSKASHLGEDYLLEADISGR